MSTPNEAVIERLIACINDRQVGVVPQRVRSRRRRDDGLASFCVNGAGARRIGAPSIRAFPQLPTMTPRRMLSAGDLVTAEATLDYDGPKYETVFIFEFGTARSPRRPRTGVNHLRRPNGGQSGSSRSDLEMS